MHAYQAFVKEHMASMPSSMSAKDKMKKIGEMWRAHKSGASMHSKKRGRPKKGGVLSAA